MLIEYIPAGKLENEAVIDVLEGADMVPYILLFPCSRVTT
jgi:hypothetical protein